MKRNFTFSKYRIKGQKYNLNFIDIFSKGDKDDKSKDNIFKVKTLINNKIKIIPSYTIDNTKTQINQINEKQSDKNNPIKFNSNLKPIKDNKIKVFNNNINNVIITSKKSDDINTNNSNQKKKIKQSIPINKNQVKSFQNVNQNYVININNNINNSYQIKMQNNQDINNKDTINKSNYNNYNYDFEKMKIVQSEEGNKNFNNSNQKTILTEISDLSCFKSNQKLFNLNSTSFPNNDNDLLSFSDDTNFGNNLKNINVIQENQNNNNNNSNNNSNKNSNMNSNMNSNKNNNKNNDNKKKKIYINPNDFQNFCKEIEEKLNL